MKETQSNKIDEQTQDTHNNNQPRFMNLLNLNKSVII